MITNISLAVLFLLLLLLVFLLIRNKRTQRLYKIEIEEKILMEKAINAANERLMLMLDTSPLCTQIWDRNLNTIDCNEAAVRLYGFKDKQEYRDKFISSCSPEFQPDGRRSDEKAVKLVNETFEKGYSKFDWMHKMPDSGALIPAEVTLVRGRYGSEDVVLGYTRDLREHDKMLETIKYREKILEVLNKTAIEFMTQQNKSFEDIMSIGLMPIIVELDLDRLSVWQNTPMPDGLHVSQIFRWDKTSGGTTEPTAILKNVSYADMSPRWEKILAAGDIINSPARLLPEAGVLKSFGVISAFVAPIFIDNVFWGFVLFEDRHNERYFDSNCADILRSAAFMCANAVIRNQLLIELVTAKKLAEQSNRAKGIFLAQMSHEIRTPINAILGISEIHLQNKNPHINAEEGFRKIYESGSLLMKIINDVLDFSKIEAGKLEVVCEKYDVPVFISDTMQINRLRYESKPIDFKLELDDKMPLKLIGDELRIRQVFNNLLSNAFKYTDTGEVKLSINFEPGNDDETIVLIVKVSDTGQGMNKNQLEKLFDEYERFNMETNRSISGTGLGLSISKRLVNLMNGEILVESEAGKGSVFTVRIPQKKCSSLVCGKEIAESLKDFSFRSMTLFKSEQIIHEYMPNSKVLVVDDVESNLYVVKGLLYPYGLHIDTAKNGLEAVEKVKNDSTYDIILMDHMMPKMDGIKATQIIREMGFSRPIIALTANALIGQAEKFLSNGFDGFIAKPIDSRELDLLLTRLIRDKEPSAALQSIEIEKTARKEQMDNMSAREKYFLLDAENAVSELRKLNTKLHELNDEEKESYIVVVHGIKSALANIDEKKLSDAALSLENAGSAGNFSAIADETSALIDALQVLIDKFKTAETDDPMEISDEDAAYLQQKLDDIKRACENFNIKTAKTALADLAQKSWTLKINNMLDGISVDLLRGDFKKIVSALGDCPGGYS